MNINNLSYLKPEYHDGIDKEVLELFESYSSKSKFDDISWYLDNLHRNISESKDAYKIYFTGIPERFIKIVKQFAVLTNTSVRVRNIQVLYIGRFLEFLESIKVTDLINVDRKIVNRYEQYLRTNTEISMRVKHISYLSIYKFFDIMESFPNTPSINPTKKINPFKVKIKSNNNKKMVPENVLKQYDDAMRTDRVPLDLRVVYWILRTIPNRIHEILSIQRNCLKPLFNHYNFLINTWKQNGGYLIPEVKTIPIKYTEHGKFLIDLIKEQQLLSKELSKKIKSDGSDKTEEMKKMLFLTTRYFFTERYPIKDISDYEERLLKENKVTIFSDDKFESQIKTVAHMFNIRDKDGNIYILKSHQLRHVNVTMRLYNGYTLEQTSILTNHKNINMLMNYNHRIEEKHKQISDNINKAICGVESKPVSFKGRISNLDERTVKILTASPRAYLMGQANGKKGVGICSNISGCKKKFECYECDFFVPKAEYLDDYKAEYEYWNDKYIMFNRTKKLAEAEKAQYNMKLLSRIIQICEYGIESYKNELLEKIKSGNVDMKTPNKGGAISAGAVK